MNKEFCLEVADAIEAEPDHFNMREWVTRKNGEPFQQYLCKHVPLNHRCGTTCCIAGAAVMLAKRKRMKIPGTAGISEMARELMGLCNSQAVYLFMGKFLWNRTKVSITAAEAAAEIRRMAQKETV